MTSHKASMSTSYKAVFVFSILMMFLVFIGGSMNGSKSSGVGVWFWGYTAWKMYKRDNETLVSLQKIMLWFEAIAFSIALAVLLFSDSDVRRYVDVTPLELILMAALSMGVTFALYKYFVKQVQNPNISNSSSNDEELWSKVSDELKNGQRVDSLWTRAFAESDGDSNKANARYIKMRFEQIRQEPNIRKEPAELDSNSTLKLPTPDKKPLGTGVILIGVAIVAYTALYFFKDYENTVGKVDDTSSTKSPTSRSGEKSDVNSCLYAWSDVQRVFVKLPHDFKNQEKMSRTFLQRLGKESYLNGLYAQLRKADYDKNENLARSIATEIQNNSIVVYYDSSFSSEYVLTLATQHNLAAKCY